MKKASPLLLLCFFPLFSNLYVRATHNRSGEILYYKIPGAFTYSIVSIKYMNDGQNIADRCVDTIYFGDGTIGIAHRLAGSLSGCGCPSPNGCGDLIVNTTNYKVKKSVYVVVHTYPGPGSYFIRSVDPSRSPGSANIPNSINVPFYLESLLIIDAVDSDNSSPQLARPPIDQAVVGTCFYHNPCAYDPDGDSLSFEITPCRTNNGQSVPGYSYPNAGPGGTYAINAETGLLTWCNPQTQDAYNLAFLIKEWRRPTCNSPYELKGYVMRDMEVLVATGSSSVITTSAFTDTCVIAGDLITIPFTALFGSAGYNFEFQVLGSASSPFSGASPAIVTPSTINTGSAATINWNTSCAHAQRGPHYIHLVVTAKTAPIPRTVYRTFKVNVAPPQPTITSVTTSTNNITITWNNLTSCSKIKSYNVYRNFNNSSGTPANCVQGVPGSSGYSLVATIPSGTAASSQFADNDIWWLPATATGNYIVTALTKDCAESRADTIITKKLLVGLEEKTMAEPDWDIFPNPSSSQFFVFSMSAINDPVHTTLISSDGKMIKQKTFDVGEAIVIDGSDLPVSVYILELTIWDKTYQRKLFKN